MYHNEATHPEFRCELLRQLSRAVQTGNISGGLRLAETARTVMTDRNDLSAGQFRRHEAQLLFASREYQKALTSARLAASLLTPFGETADLAYAFLVTGMALINLGNYREAETALLDAESLFRRCDDVRGRLDSINQLARICFTRAEYKNALKYLLEAIKLADASGDRHNLASLWGNLGRLYTLLGNFHKATEALEVNIEISGELGDDREKVKALLSLGYVEMLGEQYEKAEADFAEAYRLLATHDMQRQMVIYQTFLGELRTRRHEYGSARRLLNEAVDGARTLAPESSLMVAPLRHLAALELATGNLTAASQLANRALALANKIEESIEKGAALRILAQIAAIEEATGRRTGNKSNELFNQALETFEEIDARFERAETLVLMATTAARQSRWSLACLFRAADIYRRLGLTGKFNGTQTLINQTDLTSPVAEIDPITGRDEVPTVVTASRRMQKILTDLRRAARTDLPVLLCGETGTGKDLLAQYYHIHTGRKGRFVPVNCAAFPDTLLESELFGYRKGAFTGANADKDGLLHRADGGTFFLDEIGELSLVSQAKLLTVIETCRTRRLGDTAEEALDIHFIAATNCNLDGMVVDGKFRRDLYYRLSGITFTIPSLAERPEDIPLLLAYFLRKEGALAEDDPVEPTLISEFSSRSWPGNVRQLESEVKKLILFSAIAREDSLGDLAGVLVQDDTDSQTASLFNQVEQFEKGLIIRALRQADGNKSRAARSLAIHESTLRAKMKRYDLEQMSVS